MVSAGPAALTAVVSAAPVVSDVTPEFARKRAPAKAAPSAASCASLRAVYRATTSIESAAIAPITKSMTTVASVIITRC